MCYWYERGGNYIRCEVHRVDRHFELVIVCPHGTTSIERYTNSEDVLNRQTALQQSLLGGGWNGPHGRHV